ncbi:helicase associated domain-containing protein [[Kitasatospora] papulosa]|uniref:helicase associated domain-containing protein n=1 Tax=[Kitasatospora] papulosa TaxID=1464011 RepID=UPI0036786822
MGAGLPRMHRRPHRTRRDRPPVPGTRGTRVRTPPLLAPVPARDQRAACTPGPLPGGDRIPAAACPAAAAHAGRGACLRGRPGRHRGLVGTALAPRGTAVAGPPGGGPSRRGRSRLVEGGRPRPDHLSRNRRRRTGPGQPPPAAAHRRPDPRPSALPPRRDTRIAGRTRRPAPAALACPAPRQRHPRPAVRLGPLLGTHPRRPHARGAANTVEGAFIAPAPPPQRPLPQPPAADGTPPAPQPKLAKRLRGHSLQAEHAFERSLAHAHVYHQQHGHLAVPKEDAPDGYPLGGWLSGLRTRHAKMPAHQAAALHALYPWWNAPWSTLWQRTWHQARDHTHTHGPLDPARGFPTTSYSLGEWLYLQCTRYPALHPEQQRLLTQIGINAAAAAAARPRRRNMRAGAEEALTHARSYTAEHGHLAQVSATTVHHGYPLGLWLAGQRSQQQRRVLSPERQQALHAIDSWWCPPWNLKWQRPTTTPATPQPAVPRARRTALMTSATPEPPTGCGASAPGTTSSTPSSGNSSPTSASPPRRPAQPGNIHGQPREHQPNPRPEDRRTNQPDRKGYGPRRFHRSTPHTTCHRTETSPRAPQPPGAPPRPEAGLRNSPGTRPSLARRTRSPRGSP